MNHWLVKSEPDSYSWDQLVKDGRTNWNGVRNPTAVNNLKAMKKGDRVFFYHSNEGLEIVGIAEVTKEFYPDPADKSGRFGMVDIAPVAPLKTPVTLKAIKADPKFADLALVRLSRLSVSPVSAEHWKQICQMGGVKG
jgi:predicted RNA-binding protein with PUA-like domain